MTSKKALIGLFTVLSITTALSLAFSALAMHATHAAGTSNASGTSIVTSLGKPRLYQFHHHLAAIHASGGSLVTWSSSFTYSGTTYPYTMVGTGPSKGSATTTVATKLIPLKVVFSNGSSLSGSGKTSLVKNSPLYQNATYSSGTTQYGDAMQRAEFWGTVNTQAQNYHVLLGTPTVTSTVTINVPAADGYSEYVITSGGQRVLIGLVDINWFDSQIQGLLSKFSIAPQNFPIFLSNNVYLTDSGNCCVLGYHNAITTLLGNQTYAWGSYISPGLFGPGVQDIDGLSHEVAEWLNDPYTNNTVPNWSVPSEPQYGCSNALEVGDPLVGTAFSVKIGTTTYHPQDIAFFSWFARQSPSIGINGQYTYLGTFSTYSPSC